MAKGDLLGHIDCPYCGWKNGMRVTEDRSGNPFGYCEENCSGQLPVKNDQHRRRSFFEKYPHLKAKSETPPVNQAAAAVPVTPSAEGVTEIEQKPRKAARCLLEA